MAKPIFLVKLPNELTGINPIEIINSIKIITDNEYHVLITQSDFKKISFECFNDCKGLKDIDIEKLINDLVNA